MTAPRTNKSNMPPPPCKECGVVATNKRRSKHSFVDQMLTVALACAMLVLLMVVISNAKGKTSWSSVYESLTT